MGMFSSNSVSFRWTCACGVQNRGLITQDEDPVYNGDSTKLTCHKCGKSYVATINVQVVEVKNLVIEVSGGNAEVTTPYPKVPKDLDILVLDHDDLSEDITNFLKKESIEYTTEQFDALYTKVVEAIKQIGSSYDLEKIISSWMQPNEGGEK